MKAVRLRIADDHEYRAANREVTICGELESWP